jgi:hypothetical protein
MFVAGIEFSLDWQQSCGVCSAKTEVFCGRFTAWLIFLSWDSKTWQQTSWGGHENEFTLYNAEKDVLGTGAAHHMKNAAKDICKLIGSKTTSTSAQK